MRNKTNNPARWISQSFLAFVFAVGCQSPQIGSQPIPIELVSKSAQIHGNAATTYRIALQRKKDAGTMTNLNMTLERGGPVDYWVKWRTRPEDPPIRINPENSSLVVGSIDYVDIRFASDATLDVTLEEQNESQTELSR